MKRMIANGLIVVLAVLALTAGGCATKEKEMIAELQQLNADLTNKNTELSDQLALAKTAESRLSQQVDTQDTALAQLQQGLTAAEQRAAKAAAPARASAARADTVSKITLGSDVLFSPARATLKSSGKAELNRVAKKLKSNYGGMNIRVLGRTDSDPVVKSKHLWQDNLDLSANRAMAVTRYLISKGIDPKKIETVAMGEHHPVVSNANRSGKATNRRVDILVVRSR